MQTLPIEAFFDHRSFSEGGGEGGSCKSCSRAVVQVMQVVIGKAKIPKAKRIGIEY